MNIFFIYFREVIWLKPVFPFLESRLYSPMGHAVLGPVHKAIYKQGAKSAAGLHSRHNGRKLYMQ